MRNNKENGVKKRNRLAGEVLEFFFLSSAVAAFVFCFLYFTAGSIADLYCSGHEIVMDELQQAVFQTWLRSICLAVCALIFVVVFLSLLGQRISYLVSMIHGVEALEANRMDFQIPLDGEDELTELAGTINYLAASQRELARKEQELARERENWIRAMSHDIRTPLTSILSYSEILKEKEEIGQEEMRSYLLLVESRANQIRELTDRLLGKQAEKKDRIEDVRFLMEQLAEEWEELLEDSFSCGISLSRCEARPGVVKVPELRRIFDNLISNVEKYADPEAPVELEIMTEGGDLVINEKNRIRRGRPGSVESHRIGLESIRSLVEDDGGKAEFFSGAETFEIQIRIPLDGAENETQ